MIGSGYIGSSKHCLHIQRARINKTIALHYIYPIFKLENSTKCYLELAIDFEYSIWNDGYNKVHLITISLKTL